MKRVVFVGNLVRVKGVERLLEAWAIARLPGDARLVLIGDGALRRRLERMSDDLGIADDVEFLGRRPHAEIADWMRGSHCLCLPSRSEGMPNVVVEALSCGCPVVATGVGEIPFLVTNGVSGYVVDGTADEQNQESAEGRLVKALSEALEKAVARDWDRAAIAAAMSDYTWEEAARTVADAIQDRSSQ